MLTFSFKRFDELTAQALYDILQLRTQVFVVEQNCAYQELDGMDLDAWHLQGFFDGKLTAYARIIPPHIHSTSKPAIGRVLAAKAFRKNGYGKALMQKAIDICHQYYPRQPIYISAQTYLLDFYQSLGFVPQGERYLEDGIEHVDMLWPNSDFSTVYR